MVIRRHAAKDTAGAVLDVVIACVIFDVDGTLVDSVDLHALAWQETMREFGKDVAFDQVRSQIGKGGDQLMPVFWSEEELAEKEEKITSRRAEIFKNKYLGRVRGFPCVRELFQQILSDGKKIALASSAAGEELETYKKYARIEDLVEAQTSADDADKSEPHPDIFQAALHQLGGPEVAETIVVGDTPYDIEAAARAGLRTIAVRCGGFPEATLRGALAIFDDPADMLRHYAQSPLKREDG